MVKILLNVDIFVCQDSTKRRRFFLVVIALNGDIFTSGYQYLPTPPLGQDMTQGQFLSEVF